MKRHAPAADRNRTPILDVLRPRLPDGVLVLEIASGSGQHVVHFAAALPRVTFQPTDPDPGALASIEAHRAEAALPNVLPPLKLDASAALWPVMRADAIVCINMIHIAPFACTEGLFAGASRLLPPAGLLYLYGPYRFSGAFTAPSNEAFDASLQAQNPTWGVRDVDDLVWLANEAGLEHEATIPMPANNHSLIFRKRA
jgi:SAM-dependent methyltransferase